MIIKELKKIKEIKAFYIFSDIRNFSAWAKQNQPEIKDLLAILYSHAENIFNSNNKRYYKRVVKYLGDGFFAINEYNDKLFLDKLLNTLQDVLSFISTFKIAIKKSKLHQKTDIDISFGLSFGSSIRFYLNNNKYDYAGEKINFASRLCNIAEKLELCCEIDLRDYIENNDCFKEIGITSGKTHNIEVKGYGNIEIYTLGKVNTNNFNQKIINNATGSAQTIISSYPFFNK